MECCTDPDTQEEGTPSANLEARVEELSKLVLHMQDQLSRQNHEMELLRMQLRKEQSQSSANGQPSNKRSRRVRGRTISLESGEIISDTTSMPEQSLSLRLKKSCNPETKPMTIKSCEYGFAKYTRKPGNLSHAEEPN
jgi:hypothetical protein